MKKNIAATVLMLAMLVPLVGHAQGYYRGSSSSAFAETKVYLGVKAGLLKLQSDGFDSGSASMTNLGFVFGSRFNNYMGLEFDYTQTVQAGDDDYLGNLAKSSTDTLGLFLTARNPGSFYLKGRIGYTRVFQEITGVGEDKLHGLAGGLAVGIEFSKTFGMELEYTAFPEADEFDSFGATGKMTTELVTLNLSFSYD